MPSNFVNAYNKRVPSQIYELLELLDGAYIITEEDLEKVFPGVSPEIINTINLNSRKFNISNKKRMSHFLAQTGYESGGFKKSRGESGCYRLSNKNWKIWFNLTWKEPPFNAVYDASLNTSKK